MNYEQAAAKHVEIEGEITRINNEAKKKVASLNKILADIENWFALKAQEEGLKSIPTPVGTVYWSTHYSATVANPTAFKTFVIEKGLYDLMETKASKTAVKSYIEGHGEAPPGVNFSSRKVFNLRENTKE
jgi:hypothetical protein